MVAVFHYLLIAPQQVAALSDWQPLDWLLGRPNGAGRASGMMEIEFEPPGSGETHRSAQIQAEREV